MNVKNVFSYRLRVRPSHVVDISRLVYSHFYRDPGESFDCNRLEERLASDAICSCYATEPVSTGQKPPGLVTIKGNRCLTMAHSCLFIGAERVYSSSGEICLLLVKHDQIVMQMNHRRTHKGQDRFAEGDKTTKLMNSVKGDLRFSASSEEEGDIREPQSKDNIAWVSKDSARRKQPIPSLQISCASSPSFVRFCESRISSTSVNEHATLDVVCFFSFGFNKASDTVQETLIILKLLCFGVNIHI